MALLYIYFLIVKDLLLVTKQSGKPADSLLNPNISSQKTSEILYGAENAVGRGVQFMQNVKKNMDIFFDHKAPSIVIDIEEYKNGYMDIRRRGAKIRAFTEITKENILYCKELMKIVDVLRHLDGVKGGMAVSESEYMATTILEESRPLTEVIYSNVKEIVEQNQYIFDTLWSSAIPAEQKIKEIEVTIEKMEGGKRIQSMLISNEPLYVRHFTSLFEEIWSNGIDARHRMKQVEEGGVESDIEVIQNPDRTEELYWNIVKSAEKEILLIFPTANAIIRQEKIGIIKCLAEAAMSRNIQVRILMPEVNLGNNNNPAIEESKQPLQHQDNPNNSLNIRYLQQLSDTKATILIADRKVSLVIELRDDSKSTFYEAIGLSTYSSSKAGVLSYVSIFENLWIQTELYEKLKVHDKMQKEFINIAAHELRTPIQPILGLTEAVLSKAKDESQRELLEVVVRNAKRLRSLIENILDVTRIENQSL